MDSDFVPGTVVMASPAVVQQDIAPLYSGVLKFLLNIYSPLLVYCIVMHSMCSCVFF